MIPHSTANEPATPVVRPALPVDHYRSKTLAAWLALLLGGLGVHRLYLYGFRDKWAWLFPLPTALGLLGVQRMRDLGQDDLLAWALIPIGGVTLSIALLTAIIYALTPDERWHQRFNPQLPAMASGWAAVIAAVLALFFGGLTLMGSIAFGAQKFFEFQLQKTARSAAPMTSPMTASKTTPSLPTLEPASDQNKDRLR